MSSTSLTAGNLSKMGGDKTGIDFSVLGTDLDCSAVINFVFHARQAFKTWGFVASALDVSERTAKHRLGGTRDYTVDELRTLLRSEDGLEFLMAVMGDATPKWWRWLTKVMTLAAVRRRQHEDAQEILKLETANDVDVGARRRIKGALNADKRISAAVARAETTLGLSRPDVDRVGAAADGGMVRVSGSAMAQAPAKRAYAGRGR